MAQRRAFRRGSSGRRPMNWQGGTFQALPSLAGVATTANTIVTEAILETFPDPTIVRVRGSYIFSETGINGTAVLTVGIMLIDNAALAAGVASIQTPGTDVGSDWLWWDTVPLDNVGTVAADPVRTGRRIIDSKAMRKVKTNQALVFVTEILALGASAAVVTIAGQVRVLLKG